MGLGKLESNADWIDAVSTKVPLHLTWLCVRVCVHTHATTRAHTRKHTRTRARALSLSLFLSLTHTYTHTHTHTIGCTAANKAAHLRLLQQVACQRDVVVECSDAAREAQYATNASLDGIGGGSCGRCVGELACGYAGQVHRLFQFHRGH